MNIGMFTDTYIPQISGVGTSVFLLKSELNRLGHDVSIFTTTDPKAKTAPNVYRMPSVPFLPVPTHRFGLMFPPKVLLKIRSLKLDMIHTHSEFSLGLFGKVMSQFLRVPHVHTYHTLWEDYVHYVAGGRIITPKMAGMYSKFFCNRANAVISPTVKARDILTSYGVTRPISIIPTGIDFSPFDPAQYSKKEITDLRAKFGIAPKQPVLLSVGRLAKEKSLDIIIGQMPAIIAKIPDVRLVIVGEGPAAPSLKEQVKQLNISKWVIFTGPRPWSEIGKYYQLGDAFVAASTTETQGLTYIESMAANLPIIAKFDKSIESLIYHGKTGFTFDKNSDLPALAAKVLTNDKLKRSVGAEGRRSIEHMSSKKFGEKVERLYERTTANYTRKNRAGN